jgi:hypothetical protein
MSDAKIIMASLFRKGVNIAANIVAVRGGTGEQLNVSLMTIANVASGDYFELFAYHTDTTSRSLGAGISATWWQGALIGL